MIPSHILKHFESNDPILFEMSSRVELKGYPTSTDYFFELCDAIISQQLSIKAAATIVGRFKNLFPNGVTPQGVIDTTEDVLRAQGLSFAKIKYVKDLASHVLDGRLDLAHLQTLPDKDVERMLVDVKGIGPWTAQMFLLFTLKREDIFAPLDLGLRRGITKVYGLDHEPTPKEMETLSAKWAPYRSYASRILWKSLELPEV